MHGTQSDNHQYQQSVAELHANMADISGGMNVCGYLRTESGVGSAIRSTLR